LVAGKRVELGAVNAELGAAGTIAAVTAKLRAIGIKKRLRGDPNRWTDSSDELSGVGIEVISTSGFRQFFIVP
jgi:hypothetical protein